MIFTLKDVPCNHLLNSHVTSSVSAPIKNSAMSKFDFKAMTPKDLHAYVLAHRNDQDAFYACVDKLHAEAIWVEMPPLKSPDALDHYPGFLERVLGL